MKEQVKMDTEVYTRRQAALRERLNTLDDVELDTLLMDKFPIVYDKCSRGMQKPEKTNLLLDYCRRHADEALRLEKHFEQPQSQYHQDDPDSKTPRSPGFERKWPFPGLSPFNLTDENMFFGRQQDIDKLVNRVLVDPIVIITGLPGSGKTSLVKAGLWPTLANRGYQVIYRPVYKDVTKELAADINRYLPIDEATGDWFMGLMIWHHRHRSKGIVLIIDHFEQLLSQGYDSASPNGFFEQIARLLSEATAFVHIVLIVQAEWQYSLRKYMERACPRYDINWIIDVDPLRPADAYRAVIGPLKRKKLTWDRTVVKTIISSLQTRIRGLPQGEYVHPIQLQIVLRALYLLAERSGRFEQAITTPMYEEAGGVENILRTYLVNTVGREPETWRLLALFVSPDEGIRETRRRSELLHVPLGDSIIRELDRLIDAGVVEIFDVEEGAGTDFVYQLSHEYLVSDIVHYITETPEHLGWRHAEEWLVTGTREWQNHRLLLEENRYLEIYRNGDQLNVGTDARHLVIASALRHGHEGLGYWLARGVCDDEDLELVADQILSLEPASLNLALHSLSASVSNLCQLGTRCSICVERLQSTLRKHYRTKESSRTTVASARALWALGNRGSVKERLEVAATVFINWIRENRLQVASYILTILIVLLMASGALYIHLALRGEWENIYTLHAGPIRQLTLDPDNPETVYMIISGGSDPRQGNSLYGGRMTDIQFISRGFSSTNPTDLAIVRNKGISYFYMLAYSDGILRSDDSGASWNYMNSGLPSRGLTSIAFLPSNPDKVYVGTNDWRGIVRSYDAGQSWLLPEIYGTEIWGAEISELEFAGSERDTLLAGTEDGRILALDAFTDQWVLRFGMRRGEILALAVAPSDANYAYAGTSQGVILRSTDAGNTWMVMGQSIDSKFSIREIEVHRSDPTHVFAVAYGNGGYEVIESSDGGQNWIVLPASGLPRGTINELLCQGSDMLLAATDSGLFSTRLSGQQKQWTRVVINAPLAKVEQLAVTGNATGPIYAAVGGAVFVNSDGRLGTWIHGLGLEAEKVRSVAAHPSDPQRAYAGVRNLGGWSVFHTKDGGITWELTSSPEIQPIPPDTNSLAVVSSGNGEAIVYAGTLGCGVIRSDDGGETWDTFGRTKCSNASLVDASYLAVDAADPMQVYAASGQWFFASSDGGQTWTADSLERIGIDCSILGLVSDSVLPGRVYLITRSNGFWWSNDAGNSWHQSGSRQLLTTELASIARVDGEAETLVVGASNGLIWLTRSGGRRWESIRENLAVGRIFSIIGNAAMDGKIIIATLEDGLAVYEPGRLAYLTKGKGN